MDNHLLLFILTFLTQESYIDGGCNPSFLWSSPKKPARNTIWQLEWITDCGGASAKVLANDLMVVDNGEIQGNIVVEEALEIIQYTMTVDVWACDEFKIKTSKKNGQIDLCKDNLKSVPFGQIFSRMVKKGCPVQPGNYMMEDITIPSPGDFWPGLQRDVQFTTTLEFTGKSCISYEIRTVPKKGPQPFHYKKIH